MGCDLIRVCAMGLFLLTQSPNFTGSVPSVCFFFFFFLHSALLAFLGYSGVVRQFSETQSFFVLVLRVSNLGRM